MKTFEFYVIDDPELYTWCSDTLEEAIEEICEDFEIDPDEIENIWDVEEAVE